MEEIIILKFEFGKKKGKKKIEYCYTRNFSW